MFLSLIGMFAYCIMAVLLLYVFMIVRAGILILWDKWKGGEEDVL